MSYAKVFTRAIKAMESPLVEVEVHISGGLPGLAIVGLPETAVKESKDRVRAAILNSHFEFPAAKITINLAPADLPKQGGRYDLPIAIGILIASGQIQGDKVEQYELMAELSLTGECRLVPGVIPAVMAASKNNKIAIVPKVNEQEAGLMETHDTFLANSLLEVCAFLNGDSQLKQAELSDGDEVTDYPLDFSDVKGQSRVKRALEVIASGGHHCLMVGAPGSGKSMLASRLPSILQPLSSKEAIETAAVYSLNEQGVDATGYKTRPFRHPHHTISSAALVGGSSVPKPGEISLAHNGVLFLDELPEFDRKVLEVLREPLENKKVTVSRASQKAEFPANFQLIAAMNPCPCGFLGDEHKACRCTPAQVDRYRDKLSGPFLDRIDVQIEVPRVPTLAMQQKESSETSAQIKHRVNITQQRQLDRQAKLNAALGTKEIEQYCALNKTAETLLHNAMEKFALSARVYHRLLKVSRTIADISGSENIEVAHISEALSYRFFDRQGV
jgi:magnesium chelatase family protein